jgi:hypothetical protein
MENIIEIKENKNGYNGYCRRCKEYFKNGDFIILFEKSKINRISHSKICAKCYIKMLADKMGWGEFNALVCKITEKKI